MEQQLIRLLAGNITKLLYGTYSSDQFDFPLIEFQFSPERIKKAFVLSIQEKKSSGRGQ
jgi:hypothetical protein